MQFGLIGKTLKHSFSKTYFEDKFKQLNLTTHQYELYELVSISEFKSLLEKHAFKGLNVTIPYKEEIIPFLDELDVTAQSIGAVNCIQFKNDKLIGYNTDALGFRKMLRPFWEPSHQPALILGNGGAAKAIAYVMKEMGIAYHHVVRTKQDNLANQFTYEELNEYILKHFKLIINCTPLGTYPNIDEMPAIPAEYIGKEHLVIDLIYNPKETRLLKEAKQNGAIICNGLDMLYFQAEEAWKIWNEAYL